MNEYNPQNNQNNMFDSYNNNTVTSYGPVMNGQSNNSSYHVQAQQEAMAKTEYEKPFRTTHASKPGY